MRGQKHAGVFSAVAIHYHVDNTNYGLSRLQVSLHTFATSHLFIYLFIY